MGLWLRLRAKVHSVIKARGRRHAFEQRRRWSRVKAEAKKQRWLLVGANASMLVPAVLFLTLLPVPSLWRGLLGGALIASSLWMTYGVLLIRTYPVTMGEWGESFTGEFLEWGPRRGWRVVHDIPMQHRNVDHVAITPAGVLAIETKFVGAGRDWATDSWRVRHLQDAQASARAISLLLRSQRLDVDVPVLQVLMRWGAGSPKLNHPHLEEHVVVAYGPNAKRDAARWMPGPIDPLLARTIEANLRSFQAQRDRYESRRLDP